MLIRLSHMFQAEEHPKRLSQPASVHLATVAELLQLEVTKVQEATLFGERVLADSDYLRPQYNISETFTTWKPPLLLPRSPLSFTSNRIVGPLPLSTLVSLNPMQIRAFYFTVSRRTPCTDPASRAQLLVAANPAAAASASKHLSLLVHITPSIDSTVAHVAVLSRSVLLMVLLVPTGAAVGIASCLVGRSFVTLRAVGAGAKQGKWKGVVRKECINI